MRILNALTIPVILSLWSFPALATPIYAIKSKWGKRHPKPF